MVVTPRIADPDNQGLVVEHASGLKPSHAPEPMAAFGIAAAATELLPPWGADTHDGYDIYAGNWPVDPNLVPPLPIGVHKASEGFGTFDAKFAQWVNETSARHKYRGFYHVVWPWREGKPDNYIEQQAESCFDFVVRSGVDFSPGWYGQIDNEKFSGMPRIANVEEVRRFADRFNQLAGRPSLLHYCNPVTDPDLFFSPTLSDLGKWEAQYNRIPWRAATVIRQWGGWPVTGIWNDRPCDANYIPLDKYDFLNQLVGYGEQPQPPNQGVISMGQHLGYLQLTDDAGKPLTGVFGELMMGFDSKLYRDTVIGEGIGVYGFPMGVASQSAYNALDPYNADADANWLMAHAKAGTVDLTPVLTAIAGIGSQISAMQAQMSASFSTTNSGITIVGASVAVARQQLDTITATVNRIEAAINAGGGGDADVQPVLDAIADLSIKLDNLEVNVNLATVGTTK